MNKTRNVIAPTAFNEVPHDPSLEELHLHLDELSRRYGYALAVVSFRKDGKMMFSEHCACMFGGKPGAVLSQWPAEFYATIAFTIGAASVAQREQDAQVH